MFKSLQDLKKLKKREEGQGLVEYALILVLVAVVVIVVLSLVGPAVGNIFSEVVTALNAGAEGNTEEVVEAGGTECLWDTNVYFRFPEGANSITQPFNRYSDANCETNEVPIPAGDAGGMIRLSAFPDAATGCASIGLGVHIDPGGAAEVAWCR